MKSESDPITDEEFLLRRVRIERFRYDRTPLVSPNAFEPRIVGRDPDTTGISLYREACLADPCDILATVPEEKRADYGIVRVRRLSSNPSDCLSFPHRTSLYRVMSLFRN